MLVLAAPGLAPIDLDDTDVEGFICEEWTVGPPDVREVTEPRPLADGTIDRTAYIGSRAVSLTVVAFPANGLTVQGQIDRLRAFCHPSLRPTLTWQVETDDLRTVQLRAAPGLDMVWQRTDWRRCGLSFVVPDGLVFAGDWTDTGGETRIIGPSAQVEEGRNYGEVTVVGPGVPQNLLPSDNAASAEDGTTTGVVASGGATITNTTAQARAGTHSFAMTAVNIGPILSFGSKGSPVIPSQVVTLMASFRPTAAGRTYFLGYALYDENSNVIGSVSWGLQTNLGAADTWVDVRRVVTLPSTATIAYLNMHVSPRGLATDGSETCYIDRLGVYTGDTPSATWDLPSAAHPGTPTGVVGRGYDRRYPQSGMTDAIIANPGDVSVPWRAVVWGPCTNPALINTTTGQGIYLTANGGLTLGVGQSAIIDSRERSITVDGTSRYNRLDVTRSQWWTLGPGDNSIRFAPTQYSANSTCEFSWRHAWL